MRRVVTHLALSVFLCFGGAAEAWQLPTHVGLTQRAAQRSNLDAWLRKQGLTEGEHELLGVLPHESHALMDGLANIDASLGVTPDHGRQPALAWLVAGVVIEGVGIERVRNHFIDARTKTGLDERVRFDNTKAGLDGARLGLATLRDLLTGGGFDGTGMRADAWVVHPTNPLSRPHFLEALYRASTAADPAARADALAHALLCAGSIANVLESVGAPANAHGDFAINTLKAGAPLEHWAETRYGTETPPVAVAAPSHSRLRSFFTADDGTGLADEVARDYDSPGARSHGSQSATDVAERLLPRIAAETATLLDYLFRGSLEIGTPRYQDGVLARDVQVGSVEIGGGTLELYSEASDGRRTRLVSRPTRGGSSGEVLLAIDADQLAKGKRLVAVYRGSDAAGEPIVLAALVTP